MPPPSSKFHNRPIAATTSILLFGLCLVATVGKPAPAGADEDEARPGFYIGGGFAVGFNTFLDVRNSLFDEPPLPPSAPGM